MIHAETIINTLIQDQPWDSDDWWTLGGVEVYAMARPEQDPLPAVVIHKISDVPDYPFDASHGATPWTARIECLCMGATPEAAKNTAESVVTACAFKSGTVAGIKVTAILVGTYGPDSFDPLTGTYMQPVDFIVRYVRSPA